MGFHYLNVFDFSKRPGGTFNSVDIFKTVWGGLRLRLFRLGNSQGRLKALLIEIRRAVIQLDDRQLNGQGGRSCGSRGFQVERHHSAFLFLLFSLALGSLAEDGDDGEEDQCAWGHHSRRN